MINKESLCTNFFILYLLGSFSISVKASPNFIQKSENRNQCEAFLLENEIQDVLKSMKNSQAESFKKSVCDCLIGKLTKGLSFNEYMSDIKNRPAITGCIKESTGA